jgi:hypothetical protein
MTIEHKANSDKIDLILKDDIKSKIFSIRGLQLRNLRIGNHKL